MATRKKKAAGAEAVTETAISSEITPAAPISRNQQRKAGLLIKRDRRQSKN